LAKVKVKNSMLLILSLH